MESRVCCNPEVKQRAGEPDGSVAVGSKRYRSYLLPGTGLGIAMIAGWTIGRLGMEKHVESWVYQAAGIIPVVQALLAKGAALGTVLAFMMSVIGLSLAEMIILRKVLKVRLVATFAGVVKLSGKVPSAEEIRKILSV
jgi:hypothetical protein